MTEAPAGFDEEWRVALLAMREVDQSLRSQMMADQVSPEVVWEADRRHNAVVRQFLAQHGWPRRDHLSSEGVQALWLIVQHSDHDVAFQARCLELLEAAPERDAQWRQQVALLTDRVLVGQGQPQRYGSQFMQGSDGKSVPRPIENAARVDERRRDMGLPPLAEYARRINELNSTARKRPMR